MSHFACPCLNVHLFCLKGQLSPKETAWPYQDTFFTQSLAHVLLDKKGVLVSQSNLTSTRNVGQWTVNTCMCCKQDTHASSPDQDGLLINISILLSDAMQIKSLLLSANYSQLYQLILPASLDTPISPCIDVGSPVKSCQFKTVIQSIRQQAANYLFQEQKQMEERVRLYTEQQYSTYAALQGRITRERQSLIDLVSRSFQQQQKDGMKMVLPSPFDNFPSPPTSPDNSGSTSSSDLTLDRHDPKEDFLPKAVVRLSRRLPANQRIPKSRPVNGVSTRNGFHLSKSVDTGGIFDMDGVEDEDSAAFPVSEEEDDTDDSTTDELQQVPVSPFAHHKYASSVPISVPFMTTYNHVSSRQENPTPDDPSQIAASIQALALSIRDDKEMFGDLPRRRLNTGDLVKSRPI